MWFLREAVFRDGLTGVFSFARVLAASVFGFSAREVIIFAIAANIVAGLSTIAAGSLDDRVGAKPVIVTALIGLVVSGSLVFLLHDGEQIVFWTAGLALTLFVGHAQSASRTFLARMIPPGRRRGLRPLRDDETRRVVPRAYDVRHLRGDIGRGVLRHDRHRARAARGSVVALPVKPGQRDADRA